MNALREELDELQQRLAELENEITQEATRRSQERLKEIKLPTGAEAVEKINAWLKRHNRSHWRVSLDPVASKFIGRR